MSDQHRGPGRPPLDRDGNASVRITFKATRAQRLKLQRVANADGNPISTVVRHAVDDALDRRFRAIADGDEDE